MASENQWLVYNTSEEETREKVDREPEELFVFGYACKLFRDDEKARYIEDGRHLIPWMGDDRLMIDRSVVPKGISHQFQKVSISRGFKF